MRSQQGRPCSHRGAPLGHTVELRGLGAKQCDEPSVTHGLAFDVPLLRGIRSRRTTQLRAKICIRRPALDFATAFLNRMPQLALFAINWQSSESSQGFTTDDVSEEFRNFFLDGRAMGCSLH
jgi:hypothetical protein